MNGDIGKLSWTRIVEDDSFVDKFKLLVKNKKCVS